MTTTTSSSKLSLFKKEQFAFLYRFALKKTAGWAAIYTILLFLSYPLVTFTEVMDMMDRLQEPYFNPLNNIMNYQLISSFLVSALMCGMVLVLSAVLYSYMHGRRSADFFHSMPVDRSVMLSANFAAGFTVLVLPIVLNTILASLAYLMILSAQNLGSVLLVVWLQTAAWILGAFVLLAIGTMVAVCVSTAVESVGYTVALLLEGSVILLIWDMACENCFNTYLSIFSNSGIINNFYRELLFYLSPVFALGRVILQLMEGSLSNITVSRVLTGINWLPLILWTVLGAGALILAVKLYNKRHSERAQQWGRQSLLGFAVKLMSAIIGTFLFGVIFGELLDLPENLRYTFGALFGAPIVYIIIEAITNKGFTNMKKCLPYLGMTMAIVVTGSLYFVADGFHFDERIPEPEQVKTVDLELLGLYDLESKYSDKYAKEWSEVKDYDIAVHFSDYSFVDTLKFYDLETIELVTELHEQSLEREGEYVTYANLSYDSGMLDINRRLNLYANSNDTLLEILHSDEYLENYNPFFELKGSYLNFVHITDKVGNLLGEGEIPAEAYDKLLDAIRADLKNAEPAALRDVKNNQEIAQLTFSTKYPQEIYESSGELYHYDMLQNHIVRKSDANTCRVLNELGFELAIADDYYEKLLSVDIMEGYRSGNVPGMTIDRASMAVYDKYNYTVGQIAVTDPQSMKKLVEEGSNIYSGYGDQYRIAAFLPGSNSQEINGNELYVDRAVVAEIMAESENYLVPYILTTEEWDILNHGVETNGIDTPRDTQYAVAEEYFYWFDVTNPENLENTTSMLDYCKEYHPEILDGKTDAELKCMANTPLLNNEYGSFYRIHW